MMAFLKLSALLALTAVLEIAGRYLLWLVLRQGKSVGLPRPAAAALTLLVGPLTAHPAGAGRTYAAYGGMYIAVVAWVHFLASTAVIRCCATQRTRWPLR